MATILEVSLILDTKEINNLSVSIILVEGIPHASPVYGSTATPYVLKTLE